MKKKLTTLLLIIPFLTFAQLDFDHEVIIGEDDFITEADVLMAENQDMDGDGDLDIIVRSLFQIGWYENLDGLGSYSSQRVIFQNLQGGIEFAQTGDMDSDGDLDIVFVLGNLDDLFWIQNIDGQGNFGTEILIDSVAIYTGLRVSDIDSDNDLDILVDSDSQGFSWYENIGGTGSFAAAALFIPASGTNFTFYPIDVDDNGTIDIVDYNNQTSELIWYENLGNMNFSASQFIASGTGSIRNIQRTDIDNDNDIDLVASAGLDLYWFENTNNQGSFTTTVIDSGTHSIAALDIFDPDVDSDQDIVIYRANGRLEYLENLNGLGTFGSPVLIDEDTCPTSCQFGEKINVFDVDGDGFEDIVFTKSRNLAPASIFWIKNTNGTGTFNNKQLVNEFLDSAERIRVFDADNDGDLDILTGESSLILYRNNGSGFDRQEYLIYQDFVSGISEIDLDNDGDLDIIAYQVTPGVELVWLENLDGAGTFSSAQVIDSTFTAARDLYVGDIDGDTFDDVAVIVNATVGNDEQIVWFRNLNGTGNFSSPIPVGIDGANLAFIELADLDTDGDLDIVASSLTNEDIRWHENLDGNGTFGPINMVPALSSFRGFNTGDIDDDGDLDIIAVGSDLSWVENTDGQGSFGPPIQIGDPTGTLYRVILYDMDNDQDLDAVVKLTNGNGVMWFENLDGNGNFGPEILIGSLADTPGAGLAIGDLTGDSKPDIVYTDKITVGAYTPIRLMWARLLGETTNQIIGEILYDLDGSGCGGSDPFVENLLITTTDGVNTFSTFTLPNGFYSLNVGEGEYTTTVSSALPNYYSASPSEHVFNFVGIGNTEIGDFCIEPNATINDLEVQIFPVTVARPGFPAEYTLVYRNNGTTSLDGDVSFAYDETLMDYDSSTQTPTSTTPGAIVFDFADLNPFETRSIQITFVIEQPPVVEDGDLLTFEAVVTPTVSDDFPEDNVFILEQIVVNSFDPNDIIVLEGETIPIDNIDDYVHYLIRFQNIGSASAINVLVTNSLDDNLDWDTLQILDESHSMEVQIENGQNISFIFDDINLPSSSTNEELSNGYIAYKIKPLSNLDIGDSFSNNAEIFFDFNPPIATNTVTTTIVEELGISNVISPSCLLTPNPTTGRISIRCDQQQVKQVIVMDVHGRIVFQREAKDGMDQFGVEELSSGLYYVELLNTEGNTSIHKILKQ